MPFIYRYLLFLILSNVSFGCVKKHVRTISICDNKLYVQVYNINPAGIDKDILTDSSTFWYTIGSYDNEHEIYSYCCFGDTVLVKKMASNISIIGELVVVKEMKYSISKLKNHGNH